MITFTLMSLVTSIKDYVEIAHKLIELQPMVDFNQTTVWLNEHVMSQPLKNYTEFGSVFTYFIFSIGDFFKNLFSFSFLKNIWSIPIIIPDVASAMISEVSVLDGYFHLDNIVSINPNTNSNLMIFEKFIIGLINSLFLILPTSTSHLITIRRFVMQGLEAGYLAGLGTLAGNFLWLFSIIFGLRFFIIPWLSLDILRYLLGFILVVKYIWDSSKERRMALEDLSKWKIFGLNFLLTLTEQSCIYPFISNITIGPDASVLEGFPVENYTQFLTIHGAYLLGILLGSFSLLQFTCWFWENPAFSIYLWITTKSSIKITTSSYYKILNFTFLYAIMLCAIASIPFYGLDYTLTNPIGLVPQDRILDQKKSQTNPDKLITETAFLNINPTDKNSRIKDGVHARRERWKQRLIKYQAFDPYYLQDTAGYDFLTIEDLNYGFDRFWLRRKMRNHQIRFRLFPGPWMRSLKKQLNNPANLSKTTSKTESEKTVNFNRESASGPRVEFFRVLFEQFYHPNFHSLLLNKSNSKINTQSNQDSAKQNLMPLYQENQTQIIINKVNNNNPAFSTFVSQKLDTARNIESTQTQSTFAFFTKKPFYANKKLSHTLNHSALQKYIRNVNKRLSLKKLKTKEKNISNKYTTKLIYSKRWKLFFSKLRPSCDVLINNSQCSSLKSYQLFKNVAKQLLLTPDAKSLKLKNSLEKLSTKEQKILKLRSSINTQSNFSSNFNNKISLIRDGVMSFTTQSESDIKAQLEYTTNPHLKMSNLSLRPVNIYLQKEQAFKRRLRYYGPTSMRKLTVGNQSPYFKTLMKRGFYYYKPSLRWKKTLYVAKIIRGFRKKSRKQRILIMPNIDAIASDSAKQNLDVSTFKTNEAINSFNLSQSNNNTSAEVMLKTLLLARQTSQDSASQNLMRQHQDKVNSLSNVGGLKISYTDTASQLTNNINNNISQIDLKKPTHSYTVLGKHASRYRHQIYKDVLQHWYYTPFNRLLLKLDVDAFINRQPKSHFLTKNEERLLHIRRFLLSEHYDTLRWYTYMQHYKTMKTNIGGRKSFANGIYNQQFQGTFKKIRHLFAITPKQGDFYNLKFDQPLYNDNKMSSNIYYHEELLTDYVLNKPVQTPNQPYNTDTLTLLKSKVSDEASPIFTPSHLESTTSQNSEKPLNYISDNLDLLDKTNLLLSKMLSQAQSVEKGLVPNQITLPIQTENQLQAVQVYNELFVKLIKECKKRVHDQAFLKNYITHRVEKREQLNQEQQKELNKRFEKLKIWYKRFATPDLLTNPVLQNSQDTALLLKRHQDDSNLSSSKNVLTKLNLIKMLILENTKQPYTSQDSASQNLMRQHQDKVSPISQVEVSKEKSLSFQNITTILKTNLKQIKPLLFNYTIKPITEPVLLMLKARTEKNIYWWRKKQQVITKRKNARKRDRFKKQISTVKKQLLQKLNEPEKSKLYQKLYGTYRIEKDYFITNPKNNLQITNTNLLRQKQSNQKENIEFRLNTGTAQLDKNILLKQPIFWEISQKDKQQLFSLGTNGIRKKVSAKGRRYRASSLARYLTATRKPRLVGFDGLTKLDNITNLNGSFFTKEEKEEYLNLIYKLKGSTKINLTDSLKKSQIKKRNRHTWKKHARHLFNSNHYKYRKRHIHGNGKLRVMYKKIKKNKAINELRQWWWTSFLPRYLNKSDINKQSIKYTKTNVLSTITDTKFKPLSNTHNILPELKPEDFIQAYYKNKGEAEADAVAFSNFIQESNKTSLTVEKPSTHTLSLNTFTTSLPFYAGWDDSLRKFVVTNRLLSRRDAGLISNNFSDSSTTSKLLGDIKTNNKEIDFKNTPIQGLNEGSFLYWQTSMPFNSYNIDQFISTNQSFYAPLGWRRFDIRHTILKTWISNLKYTQKTNNDSKYFSLVINTQKLNSLQQLGLEKRKAILNTKKATEKALSRRIKKRYKLIKQMPNILMYTPTGPLLTQVLPSHYISVFDQQYRFPRNRYLKRTTLKTLKKTTLLTMLDSIKTSKTKNKEFTLRKRVKPRRKYHRKRFIKKDGLIFPRRTKFTTSLTIPENTVTNQLSTSKTSETNNNFLRWRPSSKSKQTRLEKQQQKTKVNKRVKTNPLRLRQLRRREFQQILKPIQRYIPQNGGFAWPGDYLRLEIVDMPKLKSTTQNKTKNNLNTKSQSVEQRKINLQPVGIMSRKYLIEKHNIKVLKKKLEKAYSSHQLNKIIKEYKKFYS
uniref:Hypothetical chloroplast RF1 n=1 Tax=Pandorina colemaniae TaxID=47786 RepID=A0A6C0RWK5_9CHLO|nr:hypothetical chloroplast RF1 [Pandorina colemaniae]